MFLRKFVSLAAAALLVLGCVQPGDNFGFILPPEPIPPGMGMVRLNLTNPRNPARTILPEEYPYGKYRLTFKDTGTGDVIERTIENGWGYGGMSSNRFILPAGTYTLYVDAESVISVPLDIATEYFYDVPTVYASGRYEDNLGDEGVFTVFDGGITEDIDVHLKLTPMSSGELGLLSWSIGGEDRLYEYVKTSYLRLTPRNADTEAALQAALDHDIHGIHLNVRKTEGKLELVEDLTTENGPYGNGHFYIQRGALALPAGIYQIVCEMTSFWGSEIYFRDIVHIYAGFTSSYSYVWDNNASNYFQYYFGPPQSGHFRVDVVTPTLPEEKLHVSYDGDGVRRTVIEMGYLYDHYGSQVLDENTGLPVQVEKSRTEGIVLSAGNSGEFEVTSDSGSSSFKWFISSQKGEIGSGDTLPVSFGSPFFADGRARYTIQVFSDDDYVAEFYVYIDR